MNGVIFKAILDALEARVIAGLEAARNAIPGNLDDPAINAIEGIVHDTFDKLDIAALEQDTLGRLVALVQAGKGPTSSNAVDLG